MDHVAGEGRLDFIVTLKIILGGKLCQFGGGGGGVCVKLSCFFWGGGGGGGVKLSCFWGGGEASPALPP